MRKKSKASGYCSLARKYCCMTGVCRPVFAAAMLPRSVDCGSRDVQPEAARRKRPQALTGGIDHEDDAAVREVLHFGRQGIDATGGRVDRADSYAGHAADDVERGRDV